MKCGVGRAQDYPVRDPFRPRSKLAALGVDRLTYSRPRINLVGERDYPYLIVFLPAPAFDLGGIFVSRLGGAGNHLAEVERHLNFIPGNPWHQKSALLKRSKLDDDEVVDAESDTVESFAEAGVLD